jgi:hypothetical protein
MKSVERWLLFKYVGHEFTTLSKALNERSCGASPLETPEEGTENVAVGVIGSIE